MVADILRVIMRKTTIQSGEQTNQMIDNALATASHALCCSLNHTMNTFLGNLVFGQDMFIDLPLQAKLEIIRQRRQQLIDTNLARHNRRRYDYHYCVGDDVLVKTYDPTKMEERLHGPYLFWKQEQMIQLL